MPLCRNLCRRSPPKFPECALPERRKNGPSLALGPGFLEGAKSRVLTALEFPTPPAQEQSTMSRGRSLSPRPLRDADADMKEEISGDTKDAKVVIITNLTRNVVETHLRTIFGFYGEISKIDLPLYANCAFTSTERS